MEVESVTLVEGVNLSTRRDADVGVGEDELSNSLQMARGLALSAELSMDVETYIVKGVAVDSTAGGDDKVGGRSVHAVTVRKGLARAQERRPDLDDSPSRDHLLSGAKDIRDLTLGSRKDLVDTKDGSNVDTGIDVGSASGRARRG